MVFEMKTVLKSESQGQHFDLKLSHFYFYVSVQGLETPLYKDFVLFVTFDVQAQTCTSIDTNIIWKFGQRFENRLKKHLKKDSNSLELDCYLLTSRNCNLCLSDLSDLSDCVV